jgi:RHS repeat-associated protein
VLTTYQWDYANRLIALGVNNASTTYGYDAFGARVFQIVATTSTLTYPFKFFSIASTTKSSTNYATSSEYVFNGDTLLSTVDQAFRNGTATGTAAVRYVHPDHLGSTNVVTDQNQNLVQTLDYYPYGATRISNSTSTNEKRKFIGQFSDESGLSYLNARYYSPSQGRFISQDPVFWEVGQTKDGWSVLANPQMMNSYNYAGDNPITNKDADGRFLDIALDIGFMAYDAYKVGQAYATGGDVREQLGYLGLDAGAAAIPGVTGVGLVARAAKNGGRTLDTVEKLSKVSDLRVGDNIGKFGTVVDKFGQEVTGYRVHGLKQATERGLSDELIKQTTKNPSLVLQQAGGSKNLFLSPNAGVVLNRGGQVVTAYGKTDFKPIIQTLQKILETIKSLR